MSKIDHAFAREIGTVFASPWESDGEIAGEIISAGGGNYTFLGVNGAGCVSILSARLGVLTPGFPQTPSAIRSGQGCTGYVRPVRFSRSLALVDAYIVVRSWVARKI